MTMDWAGLVRQLEDLWYSPTFPMWATLTGAIFFGLVLLITLARADRSVANGALAVITLLAISVAAAATVRGNMVLSVTNEPAPPAVAQGALACLDGLSGDKVEAACEKALFGSADSTAAAVSYTAAQISRLPIAANQATPELAMLRRVLERDRYGLAAQVLLTREGCTPSACETFRHLVNTSQIVANMNERVFEQVVARHEDEWGEGATLASVRGGKPANIDYPSSSSIPPISIMTSDQPRSESQTQASAAPSSAPPSAAASSPAPVAPPIMAVPSNVLPFPAGTPSAPANQQAKRAPASVPTPAPAPAKRAAAPAPVPLIPQ